MIELYRSEIAKTRAAGVSLMVLPGLPGMPPIGMAYSSRDGRFYIDITCHPRSPKFLYVLFHEIAHCVLGHTTVASSIPTWITEKAADDLALQMLRKAQPYAVVACEPLAKKNVRRYLQPMIDARIDHHVDLECAKWAGCHIPDDLEEALAQRGIEHPGDHEITF